MSTTPHWSAPYLGKPWVNGARGPDEFDCWGLLWHVYKTVRGIELPLYPGVDAKNRALVRSHILGRDSSWQHTAFPREFAGVALGAHDFTHIGIFTEADGGLIVHVAEKHNVIAQKPSMMRAAGFGKMQFYQWL